MPNYKKTRKPNPFKVKKEDTDAGNIKLSKKEKLEMDLPKSKRKIQEAKLTIIKVSTLSKEDREMEEMLLERKLNLNEMLSVKKEQKTIRSKKPAKINCKEADNCTTKEKRQRKPAKSISILSKKRLERLLERQKEEEAIRLIQALDSKKAKQEKAESKKERVLAIQLKSKEIEKANEEKKAKEEKEDKKPLMPKGAQRKLIRSLMNGRRDGKKNRQKDRIMTLRTSGREFLETYTTKKGQEKNRYIHIPNPEIRKTVVLDKTKPLPVFDKQKSEE